MESALTRQEQTPHLEKNPLEYLQPHQVEALAFFDKIYVVHRQFSVENNIELTDFDKIGLLEEKRENFRCSLVKRLLSHSEEGFLSNILKDRGQQFLDEHFDQIFSEVNSWIKHFFAESMEMRSNIPKDFLGLLDARTVHVFSFNLVNKLVMLFPSNILSRQEKRKAASDLLHLVLDVAVEQKMIASWQPFNPESTEYEQIIFC